MKRDEKFNVCDVNEASSIIRSLVVQHFENFDQIQTFLLELGTCNRKIWGGILVGLNEDKFSWFE